MSQAGTSSLKVESPVAHQRKPKAPPRTALWPWGSSSCSSHPPNTACCKASSRLPGSLDLFLCSASVACRHPVRPYPNLGPSCGEQEESQSTVFPVHTSQRKFSATQRGGISHTSRNWQQLGVQQCHLVPTLLPKTVSASDASCRKSPGHPQLLLDIAANQTFL